MTIKKLDPPEGTRQGPCRDPDHNVPMHLYLGPGTYEHVCPRCGDRIVFTMPAKIILDGNHRVRA